MLDTSHSRAALLCRLGIKAVRQHSPTEKEGCMGTKRVKFRTEATHKPQRGARDKCHIPVLGSKARSNERGGTGETLWEGG